MLRFFRSIRSQLLNNNKTGKYFRYAIGEILLVVIGILIALQINNWNEGRKQKAIANEYRKTLINDIAEDTANIHNHVEEAREFKNDIDAYFEFFRTGNSSVKDLVSRAQNTRSPIYRYQPINHTFLSMQSSGGLNLLSEPEKRILMELSIYQNHTGVVFEKLISDFFVRRNKRNEFLQNDGEDGDFYEVIGKNRSEEELILGLKYQNLLLSNNRAMQEQMIKRGKYMLELSREVLSLLEGRLNN